MQRAALLRRAAGVEGRVGRGSGRWCFGRYICLNCPKPHHLPPFQPFALPIHRREHLARHPRHRIEWWCWDHLELEDAPDLRIEVNGTSEWRVCKVYPNGRSPIVTQPTPQVGVALGASTLCNHLWLITPTTPNCPLCAHPPTHSLPFAPFDGASVPTVPPVTATEAPPEEHVLVRITCPTCHTHLDLAVAEDHIDVTPTPQATPVEEAAGSPEPDLPAVPSPGQPATAPDTQPEAPADVTVNKLATDPAANAPESTP